jgi:hypothetical protein
MKKKIKNKMIIGNYYKDYVLLEVNRNQSQVEKYTKLKTSEAFKIINKEWRKIFSCSGISKC